MNSPNPTENTALTVASQQPLSTQLQPWNLMLDSQLLAQQMAMAEAMSKALIAVPQHFRGKPADCLAVVMQATQWRMNPFAVAQKTHVVNGALGYEAQLVHAVLQSTGAIEGTFSYEYRGSGNALECRVGAVPAGGKFTWGEWLSIGNVTTKNSPLWKTNPPQQMGYLQVKNWARAFAPGAILGVYTPDELANTEPPPPPSIVHMGAAEVVATPAATSAPASATGDSLFPDADGVVAVAYPDDEFQAAMITWQKAVTKGMSAAEVMNRADAAAQGKGYHFTERQRATILSLKPQQATQAASTSPRADAPQVTFAQVADAIVKAATVDALNDAAALIAAVPDAAQREELTKKYEARDEELTGGKAQ